MDRALEGEGRRQVMADGLESDPHREQWPETLRSHQQRTGHGHVMTNPAVCIIGQRAREQTPLSEPSYLCLDCGKELYTDREALRA